MIERMFRIVRYCRRSNSRRRYVAAAIMGGTATIMLTNNTFEAEEVDLSIPEIERLLSSIRRRRQVEYNEINDVIPESVRRADQESLHMTLGGTKVSEEILAGNDDDIDVAQVISDLKVEMQESASKLEFEKAALIRDQIDELQRK